MPAVPASPSDIGRQAGRQPELRSQWIKEWFRIRRIKPALVLFVG